MVKRIIAWFTRTPKPTNLDEIRDLVEYLKSQNCYNFSYKGKGLELSAIFTPDFDGPPQMSEEDLLKYQIR